MEPVPEGLRDSGGGNIVDRGEVMGLRGGGPRECVSEDHVNASARTTWGVDRQRRCCTVTSQLR